VKTKTILALTFAALVFALGAALASADAGSAVQADLTQLGGDISAAHSTLIPDFNAITTAAQNGDKAAVIADIKQAQSDAATLLPAIRTDRGQLVSDLTAARGAHITGLGATVKAALVADQAAIKDIRDAARQARHAVQALRGGGTSTTGTGTGSF
jgi:hypothetical protein